MKKFLASLVIVVVGGCSWHEFSYPVSDQPAESTALFDWSPLGVTLYRLDRIDNGQRKTIFGVKDFCITGKRYNRARLPPGEYEYYYDYSRFHGTQRFKAEAGQTYLVKEESCYLECAWSHRPYTVKIWVVDKSTEESVSSVNTHSWSPAYSGTGPPPPPCERYRRELEAEIEKAQ